MSLIRTTLSFGLACVVTRWLLESPRKAARPTAAAALPAPALVPAPVSSPTAGGATAAAAADSPNTAERLQSRNADAPAGESANADLLSADADDGATAHLPGMRDFFRGA